MKKTLSIIFLATFLCASMATAEEYGGEFLNLPVGAKAMGMGGAFGPVADDASALYWNPAGLGRLKTPEIMLTHTVLFANLASHDYLALVWPMNRKITVGAGWIRLGVDDIPRFSYTVGTPPVGSFGDNENAFFFSAGASFDKITLGKPWKIYPGGSIKFIYNKLDDRQATGLGVDAGILIDIDLAEWFIRRAESRPLVGMLPVAIENSNLGLFSLSAVAQDVGGTSIAWNTVKKHNDVRPAIYKMGLAYRQPVNIFRSTVTIAWEGSTEDYQKGRLGTELKYRNILAFRAGREQSQPTFGAGLSIWRFNVDYAHNSHDLGNTHRVGGSYKMK
ncbi:MAG: hypothetical protein KJ620_03215 [Candidatus Edwardsbacteria bacterium]|nr:hypothetical protein [Candidatus Edwardsbacteria bacterium]MBU2462498.1 hypothetical protein [Candidatus Edwardsbacteria bacterium]MBU2593467.1 hypothetical protein [Candidatus Edwardsbacteria bacterium]